MEAAYLSYDKEIEELRLREYPMLQGKQRYFYMNTLADYLEMSHIWIMLVPLYTPSHLLNDSLLTWFPTYTAIRTPLQTRRN